MNLSPVLAAAAVTALCACHSEPDASKSQTAVQTSEKPRLEVGDIVFTRIDNPLYREVARATGSWTSHVGLIVDATPGVELVAESAVPFSKVTPLKKFIARSADGMYAVKRPDVPLSAEDKIRLRAEASARMGKLYHLGFKYDSNRQYCSKFVYDVYAAACGIEIGSVQTLSEVLAENPGASKTFWEVWYFGFIPWERRVVTPANQYRDAHLKTVCEYLPGLENV